MIRLVEPGELAKVKRAGYFTLEEIADVVKSYSGLRVGATSLSKFISGKRTLKLEAWKAVTSWYVFYIECAPRGGFDDV